VLDLYHFERGLKPSGYGHNNCLASDFSSHIIAIPAEGSKKGLDDIAQTRISQRRGFQLPNRRAVMIKVSRSVILLDDQHEHHDFTCANQFR
jgi:hypothetical protein